MILGGIITLIKNLQTEAIGIFNKTAVIDNFPFRNEIVRRAGTTLETVNIF
mgnify:CR=1 FL=1